MEKDYKEWSNDLAARIVQKGLATEQQLVGCSPSEIEALESGFNVKLPESYKAFMARLGKSNGAFLPQLRNSFYQLNSTRQALCELLSNRTDFELPETSFVFLGRFLCQFFFFDTAENLDDPPVSYYFEGEDRPTLLCDSFTTAMEMVLRDGLNRLD